jgi:chemosensory pili system protein ChpC
MSSAPQQLYAVLVALQSDTLLLPNLAVAEVVALEGLRPISGAPPWFAGMVNWQGRELPIARFERKAIPTW